MMLLRFSEMSALYTSSSFKWCCVLVMFIASISLCKCSTYHKRFEYKLSFKGPNLVQKDGSVPFWEHGGHAIASDESIRITPSLRSKKGYVWSKNKNTHSNWEVELVFRISGRGRVGADGLAFWYTEERGIEGPIFGSCDYWKGLGIFFDSFDNDGQNNNPYISAVVNDGTVAYNHESDGSTQQLGGCLRDFRNKPYPVRAKIEYYQKSLMIYFHNGMSASPNSYELCMRTENVHLPESGYFGVSGATGGLADDHDVLAFLSHSLTPVDASSVDGHQQVSDEERKKFELEFDEYWQKLQKAKQEYQKEHPNKAPTYDGDDEKYFESLSSRELKQIFDGQQTNHAFLINLGQKIDQIIAKQAQTISQISMIGQQQQGSQQQALPDSSAIQRHEVDRILDQQHDIVVNVKILQSQVEEVKNRAAHAYQPDDSVAQLKDQMNNLQNDMRVLLAQKKQTVPSTCVTPFVFFIIAFCQIAVVVGYMIYRSSKESQSKKFY